MDNVLRPDFSHGWPRKSVIPEGVKHITKTTLLKTRMEIRCAEYMELVKSCYWPWFDSAWVVLEKSMLSAFSEFAKMIFDVEKNKSQYHSIQRFNTETLKVEDKLKKCVLFFVLNPNDIVNIEAMWLHLNEFSNLSINNFDRFAGLREHFKLVITVTKDILKRAIHIDKESYLDYYRTWV